MNILELDEAQSYFKGTIDLVAAEDGWLFKRLTDRQLDHYATQENYRIRSQCAAGVMLRIRTDSPWLDMAFESLGGARSHMGLDVEVDGQVVNSYRIEEFGGQFSERLFDFSGTDHKIRNIIVYFPCSLIIKMKLVGIAQQSAVSTMAIAPRHYLALGDSITQGMGAISPLSTYAVQLSRMLDAELLNQGIGGHIFDADSLAPPPVFNPHLITIAYGTNDWNRDFTPEQIACNVKCYIGKVQDIFPGVPIHLISPIWRDQWREERACGMNLVDFGALILRAASEFSGVNMINGFRLVPHDNMYFEDGVHPNELGFMHYASNLVRAVS